MAYMAWRPRRVKLKRNAAAGSSTIRVEYEAWEPDDLPTLAKLGTELVTITAIGGGTEGDTWTLAAPTAYRHNAGGYLVEIGIRILVNGVDLSAIAQGLHHSEESPQGELEATWTIRTRTPATYTPNMDGNPTAFRLYSKETGAWLPFFGGYIGRVADKQYPSGFHVLEFTGRGAYTTLSWEGYEQTQTWAADRPGHTPVEDAIMVHAPWVSNSIEHIVDGGLQIGQVLEGIGRTPRDIIEFVTNRGDANGQALDWYVRTDPDGLFKVWLILRERNPTLEIPISSLKAPFGAVKDYEHRRTYVLIKWSGGYTPASAAGATGAKRWIYKDYSTRIFSEEMARQVAGAMLAHWQVVDALSDGSVTLEWPKPVYKNGVEWPHHLIKAGWRVTFTGWAGGFALATSQIKSLQADDTRHSTGFSFGKLLEDDLDLAEQFMDKESKRLGSPMSGLIPQNIAPPEGMPNQVPSAALPAGATYGGVGYGKVADEADAAQSEYTIQGALDESGVKQPIEAGRKAPPQAILVGGRLTTFTIDGANNTDPEAPVAGTISIAIYYSASVDSTDLGTLVTTVELTSSTHSQKNLIEPPSGTDEIVTVAPGSHLTYVVLPGTWDITDVVITRVIQRTEGSVRISSTGGPAILGQSMARDSSAGKCNFTVTTDRPCTVQIQYGETNQYGAFSQPSEIIRGSTTIPENNIKSPFHWRVIATDRDKHQTLGTDQTS